MELLAEKNNLTNCRRQNNERFYAGNFRNIKVINVKHIFIFNSLIV